MMNRDKHRMTRRRFIRDGSAISLLCGLESMIPAYARHINRSGGPGGNTDLIDLQIYETDIRIADRNTKAVTINGSVPGPLVRLREGKNAAIRVDNRLGEDTSVHWHGILLPPRTDGVPGVSFTGIKPGESFTYRFPVKQNGTYWYHSHSGLQEQRGHFGPLIIDPAEPDPFRYDHDYVVMLSDWTFENPRNILANLKKQSGYYNFQRLTVQEFFRDASENGLTATIEDRLAWGRMRMDPTDIADVTGSTYSYLINGMAPGSNWTGLFRPGERIRLRFINAAAMSYFDVSIPGLKMTVVQADGQNVQPVSTDEFRIAVAETYDVIVEPQEDKAYTIFAEAMDRSGYARGTLATRYGMSAQIPERRPRMARTMDAMGMGHTGMSDPTKSDRHMHQGTKHAVMQKGPQTTAMATRQPNRIDKPGTEIDKTRASVLAYSDLRSLAPNSDRRKPGREIEMHLTGNMDRYLWSFDGQKFSEVDGPIVFYDGERLRLTLVNDTMMDHPIHLHGMWMELDTGAARHNPRKHTISVEPGQRVSANISVDAPGNWAFHCHLLFHMDTGMFRVVRVAKRTHE